MRPSISLLTKKQAEAHLKTIGLDIKLPTGLTRHDHELASGQKVQVRKTQDKATSGGFLYEITQEFHQAIREFKVLSVSLNTNSFGLTGHILMDRNGETWTAARYVAFKRGEVLQVPIYPNGQPDLTSLSFEIPSRYKDENAPAGVIAEVWAIPEPGARQVAN